MISSHLFGSALLTDMKQAFQLGNRLVMMHRSRVILDIQGDEKTKLMVEDLIERFCSAGGEEFSRDRMLWHKRKSRVQGA